MASMRSEVSWSLSTRGAAMPACLAAVTSASFAERTSPMCSRNAQAAATTASRRTASGATPMRGAAA